MSAKQDQAAEATAAAGEKEAEAAPAEGAPAGDDTAGKRSREETEADGEKKAKTGGFSDKAGPATTTTPASTSTESSAVIFHIPNDKVGLVIGKMGSTVKDLELRSACKIHITSNQEWEGKTDPRPITLTGTASQQEKAKKFITQVVEGQQLEPFTIPTETLTITVPNEKVGLVIGSKGSSIREFEMRSGCKIQVTSNAEWANKTEPRPLLLEGTQQQIDYAKALIYDRLDIPNPGGPPVTRIPAMGMGMGMGAGPAAFSNPSESILEVPNDHVGLVIGKSGSTIKQLEQMSGAKIHIAKECPPGSSKRPITLVGSQHVMANAKRMIIAKIQETIGGGGGGADMAGGYGAGMGMGTVGGAGMGAGGYGMGGGMAPAYGAAGYGAGGGATYGAGGYGAAAAGGYGAGAGYGAAAGGYGAAAGAYPHAGAAGVAGYPAAAAATPAPGGYDYSAYYAQQGQGGGGYGAGAGYGQQYPGY